MLAALLRITMQGTQALITTTMQGTHALITIHNAGYTYNDLKLDNIMIGDYQFS